MNGPMGMMLVILAIKKFLILVIFPTKLWDKKHAFRAYVKNYCLTLVQWFCNLNIFP